MAYGAFRIFAEYFKEWDMAQFFTTPYFSEGVVYSLPMIALGAYYVFSARRVSIKSEAASGASPVRA
jgi:phosphatidylglycerol:prolipoprotein diacylglycerol transferase